MPKKFKFTKDDLDKMVLEAMGEPTDVKAKPNFMQGLLAKARLGKSRQEV